jgi:CheY-like chemotaxis protein
MNTDEFGEVGATVGIHLHEASRKVNAVDHTLASVNVLVVDDDRRVRDVLVTAFEMYGATVTAVESAQEGLTTLQTSRPDVLVSDLEMPNRDGFWLIAQVRALPPERGGRTPAVCLTGLAEPDDRAQAVRAGFQVHIVKPVHIATLIGIVQSLARRP